MDPMQQKILLGRDVVMVALLLAQNVDAGRSAVKLIDAAQQSLASLANVAAGIGTNVNLSV